MRKVNDRRIRLNRGRIIHKKVKSVKEKEFTKEKELKKKKKKNQ